MQRIQIGVQGLDEMLGGGLPCGRSILVCGGPGSGKTIFGIQFLYNGFKRCREKGIFVSLDENLVHLKENMAGFGWNLEEMEKKKELAIIDASPIRTIAGSVKVGNTWIGKRDFNMLSLIEVIKKKANEIDAKRIVIDPITGLLVQYPNLSESRQAVLDLYEALYGLGTTNLITTELRATSLKRTVNREEFLSHGVILFHVFNEGREVVRAVQIEKMRGISHDQQIRPYRICDEGLVVYPEESPLTVQTPLTVPSEESTTFF